MDKHSIKVNLSESLIKPIQVGVVGLGEHAWDNLLPSIVQNKKAIIKAVCDIDETKLRVTERNYKCKAYSSYITMLKSEELDCLVIASTPQVHFELTKLALDYKIPIFIEKPPTSNLLELQNLSKHPNFCKVLTGVGINFNYAESILMFSKLQKKRHFGKLVYLNISHLANKPHIPFWNMESLSQSFLLSQVIHPLAFVLSFGDGYEINSIKYTQENTKLFLNLNLTIFNNRSENFIVNLTSGTLSPHFDWSMELITTTGKIVKINSLWELKLFDGDKVTNLIEEPKRWMDVWHPSPVGNGVKRTGYYFELDQFFDSINTGQPFSPNLPDMIPVYEIMEIIDNALTMK